MLCTATHKQGAVAAPKGALSTHIIPSSLLRLVVHLGLPSADTPRQSHDPCPRACGPSRCLVGLHHTGCWPHGPNAGVVHVLLQAHVLEEHGHVAVLVQLGHADEGPVLPFKLAALDHHHRDAQVAPKQALCGGVARGTKGTMGW